ncbi:uncharacterized protein LOC115886770 isoform X2 [Sitophilus oryzae]|uniref:Uncharacterized protein LOC115886770 isoform X2 n=1 Tax=Sitophilus oryzae TaxID=7048 RepID=A0A6J2YF00_SITOR|nr:uncharacterized protein LOC115886770 isoform X2 [Sitophilus oryzae]
MWTIFMSLCVAISLVMSLVFCLCWKKKNTKDEWLGIDGMVTQKNPDENVNHLPSTASCVDRISTEDSIDSSKRSAVTSTRRSLPDIPAEVNTPVNWEPTGDNSSEHYATLGQYQNTSSKPALRNGLDPRLSVSQHSSISQADENFSTYERVKYDKINSKEHPYAQLQPTTSRPFVHEVNEPGQSTSEERVNLLRADGTNKNIESNIHVRSRRSSTHSNTGMDIPAATAVAGGIAANYDLPYMTPPVNQTNFSGDSQDSSKGYTSITVREPLANILAQTKEINKEKRGLDVNYSTVSDDSDDVYTTIPDPNNQIYTSESETYSKIQPVIVEAEINHVPTERRISERREIEELYELPPQPAPPSVGSLKHVTMHTHSRQASSSSSIANIGSPKPEKRQANSPLPPPPTSSHDKLQALHNVDDLYAKVCKSRKDDFSEDKLSDRGSLNESFRNSLVSSSKSSKSSETSKKEHNYETLKKTRVSNDPGYEKIKGGGDCEPGYASINGPDSLASSSDPGYEVLRGGQVPSEIDPNYEQLRHRSSNASDSGYSKVRDRNDGYSVINKKKKLEPFEVSDLIDEPKYESMSDVLPAPPYQSAIRSADSDTDPNYESVMNHRPPSTDPNYETVKEPAKLEDDDEDIPGYQKIKATASSESSNNSASKTTTEDDSEPPYERLNNDNSDCEACGGYEKVGRSKDNSQGSSGNEIPALQNEVADGELGTSYLHEEDAVVQV